MYGTYRYEGGSKYIEILCDVLPFKSSDIFL